METKLTLPTFPKMVQLISGYSLVFRTSDISVEAIWVIFWNVAEINDLRSYYRRLSLENFTYTQRRPQYKLCNMWTQLHSRMDLLVPLANRDPESRKHFDFTWPELEAKYCQWYTVLILSKTEIDKHCLLLSYFLHQSKSLIFAFRDRLVFDPLNDICQLFYSKDRQMQMKRSYDTLTTVKSWRGVPWLIFSTKSIFHALRKGLWTFSRLSWNMHFFQHFWTDFDRMLHQTNLICK